ncbi:MAG TPA: vWA domain-containing protein [Candidatus Deferrimicrobium sp.]|nr:vWA domain-containing protein [Candidatus Kapabacteria bacterium]HLP60811.1 vWA domain-containing protein [Candidatus Deferrimicrobium sp.]
MKRKLFFKLTLIIFSIWIGASCLLEAQTGRKAMYMNFQKLVLYHAKRTNEYYLAVTATDDSTRPANFDTMDVHIKLEMRNGESKLIDNGDLKVTNLGNMYNKVIGEKNTLFRFTMVIDNSGSIDPTSLGYVQNSLKKFIELVPLVFEAQVIRFSNTVQPMTSSFTKNKEELINAITQPLPQGSTALFDAIERGVQELKYKQDEIPLRFAVVLTDGLENASVNNSDPITFKSKIINECRQNYIPLFIVGVTDNVDSQLLTEIAGFGFYQHIKNFPDIEKAFNLILNVIKDTYVFKIPAVGNFNDIKTLYIVKKTPAGNLETIQDIIVN